MNNNIEIWAKQTLACGEGPVWNPEKQELFWTDSLGQSIYSSSGENIHLYNDKIHASSLTLHAQGGLMACGKDGFFHINNDGLIRVFNDTTNSVSANFINDIIADPKGRVLGGQECFKENEPYATGYLFQVGLDGKTQIIEEGLHLANGMGFSPNNDKFYLTDTIQRQIYEYDYNVSTGSMSNKRVLITIPQEDGLPDGITVDAEGYLWVALWFGNAVIRFDPDGKENQRIPVPAAQVSSLTFGGKDYNELYITTAAEKWVSPLAPKHHNFSTHRGGEIYKITLDIQGKPEHQAQL